MNTNTYSKNKYTRPFKHAKTNDAMEYEERKLKQKQAELDLLKKQQELRKQRAEMHTWDYNNDPIYRKKYDKTKTKDIRHKEEQYDERYGKFTNEYFNEILTGGNPYLEGGRFYNVKKRTGGGNLFQHIKDLRHLHFPNGGCYIENGNELTDEYFKGQFYYDDVTEKNIYNIPKQMRMLRTLIEAIFYKERLKKERAENTETQNNFDYKDYERRSPKRKRGGGPSGEQMEEDDFGHSESAKSSAGYCYEKTQQKKEDISGADIESNCSFDPDVCRKIRKQQERELEVFHEAIRLMGYDPQSVLDEAKRKEKENRKKRKENEKQKIKNNDGIMHTVRMKTSYKR